jgi:hypothetical protein
MDVITKFLEKYSYKFPKGYPDLTDPADKKLMQELLSEIGINEAPETSVFTNRTPEGKNGTYYQILKDAGLNDDVLDKIGTIFNTQYEKNPNYLSKFTKENFRGKNIEDIKDIFKIFPEFIDIKDTGFGKGEVVSIMGIKDSKSGGTAEKDILIGDKIYDIKDLAGGEFRTASGGYIHTSDFKHNLDHLLSLLKKLRGKDYDGKSTILYPDIDEKINTLLEYYTEGGYKTGGISEGAVNSIEDLCNDLKKLDLSSETQPYYIKIGNKRFTVDKETYDKIQGGESINNINLGSPISDRTSLLTKIKNHPWVESPESIKKDLNKVWEEFLHTIDGLILITNGVPELYTPEQLNSNFAPSRVVQNQIIVKSRSSIKGTKKLKEDEE